MTKISPFSQSWLPLAPTTMRGLLLTLVFVVLFPLLLVQTGIYLSWYRTRWKEEKQKTQAEAQTIAATFDAFLHKIGTQEVALGAALAELSPYSSEQASRFLRAAAKEDPSILSWHFANPEGVITSSSDPKGIGINIVDRPYFQEITAGSNLTLSDLLIDRISGQQTFVIATRVNDPEGNFFGALLATVALKELSQQALPLNPDEESIISIFDRDGVLIYYLPEKENYHPNWLQKDPLLRETLQTKKETQGVITLPPKNERQIATRVPIPALGWVAGSSQPVAVAMADVYNGLWIITGLNLLVLALSGIIAAKTSSRIIRPLRQLQQHAKAFGSGTLYEIAPNTNIQELATLSEAFNRMGHNLNQAREEQEKYHLELEQRVQERTQELDHSVEQLKSEILVRESAEISLREQARVLEAFFKHTLNCLVILDRDFNFITVNEAYAKACNCPASDFPGHNHFELYPDEENEAIFREVVQSKTLYHAVAKPFHFPDHPERGTTYWDWVLVPIVDDQNEVEFLVFSLVDVTAQKTIESELRAASLYTRSLLEASIDPLVTISHDGIITDVNEATEKATGISRGELIGSDFSIYFTEPDKARKAYEYVLAQGLLHDYPLSIRHLSGDIRHVLYNATTFRDEAGNILGVFAAARDITARKSAEDELEIYREQLEDLVSQRTDELRLSNEQLQTEVLERKQAAENLKRTAEELARSNRELEQFAYVASHDLQEPLRVVSGYVQLIQRRYQDKLDADADQFIHYITDGVTRMQQLISDLLEYSRVGTHGKAFKPTDAEKIFQRVLSNLERAIEETHALVTHDPLPVIQADETQLLQLLQNLVNNGIKFQNARRPEIHVSAKQQDSHWVFSVRDNGIGIEKEYWEKIFIIFQRLHTRQKHPGTGIGLSICKRIVERHGGRIWIESTPEVGTTFFFTLSDSPLSHTEPPQTEQTT